MKVIKIILLTTIIFFYSNKTTYGYIDPTIFGQTPSNSTVLAALSPIFIAIFAFIIKPIKNLIYKIKSLITNNEKGNNTRT